MKFIDRNTAEDDAAPLIRLSLQKHINTFNVSWDVVIVTPQSIKPIILSRYRNSHQSDSK